MAEISHERMHYESAANLVRVHGILSIIFGSLGIVISLFLMLLFGFAITEHNTYQIVNAIIWVFLTFVFGALPHAYFLISGLYLIKQPRPEIVKTLVIINLVVSVFYNLVILIFSILNLTQFDDYKRGYDKK